MNISKYTYLIAVVVLINGRLSVAQEYTQQVRLEGTAILGAAAKEAALLDYKATGGATGLQAHVEFNKDSWVWLADANYLYGSYKWETFNGFSYNDQSVSDPVRFGLSYNDLRQSFASLSIAPAKILIKNSGFKLRAGIGLDAALLRSWYLFPVTNTRAYQTRYLISPLFLTQARFNLTDKWLLFFDGSLMPIVYVINSPATNRAPYTETRPTAWVPAFSNSAFSGALNSRLEYRLLPKVFLTLGAGYQSRWLGNAVRAGWQGAQVSAGAGYFFGKEAVNE